MALGLVIGDVAVEAEEEIVAAAERPETAEIVVEVPLESRHSAELPAAAVGREATTRAARSAGRTPLESSSGQ